MNDPSLTTKVGSSAVDLLICISGLESERNELRTALAAALKDLEDAKAGSALARTYAERDAQTIAELRRALEPAAQHDADWLWGQLMNWCSDQKIHPSNTGGLFNIVQQLRDRRSPTKAGSES